MSGSYTPTVIVANNQGGSTLTSFTWTINQAQVAPTLTNPGSQSNLRGDNVSLQINASQVDGDPLTYDATNLPTGLSIDSGSGLISGTVDPSAQLGTPYSVTVPATDDTTNLSSSQTFNWTINATNVAPVLTSPGNQSNAAGDVVSLQLSASDADGDPLTYTATGLPAGLTLDPISGLISGTLPNSAASSTPYSVTVTASDGLAKNSQTFNWTVSTVGLTNPGAQSNLDGTSVSVQLTGTDAAGLALTYSATGLPGGLTISSTTGLISGTLSNTDDTSSPYAVTVTATDSSNNSASQSFTWTVARLALNPVANQDNQEGTAVSLQLSSIDVPGTPSYSATGLPAGLSISSTTGLISGTLGTADHGSSPYQVTVKATDGSNSASQSFVWTVTPRVALVNPGPRGNAVGDSVSLQLSATSPGGTMSYSASGLPPGLSISSTGLISGTPTTASATPYTVTVTANDGTSSSSQMFAWTVSTIWITPPAAPTNLDGDTVSLPLTTAYHGTGTLSYTATGLPAGLSISSTTGQITGTLANTDDTSSPYQVTVSATDGTNSGSQTFNWTVNPRVSIDPITDQSNAVGDTVSLQVTASDALSSTLSYSATNLPSGLTISSTTGLISGTIGLGADTGSPYAVTVTVTDSAGVSATQSFNWTVAHVALANPGPQWSVDGHAVSLQMQGSDADHDTVTWTASGLPSGLSISSTGLISGTLASNADANSPYVVTVTASDGMHSTSQTFLWTVSQVSLTVPSNQTNTEGDTVSLQLQGLASSGSLTYSASGLPAGLSLNATTGLISGTIAPGAAAAGPFTVDVSASNGTDSVSQTFTWTVNPVVALTAVADQSNAVGNSVSLQVSATDSKHASLTYTAQGLPSGLSINSTTGLITGTVASGDAANSPYAVTVTASDGTYSSNETFTWTVTHTDTTALTMTNPGTQTDVAGDSVNVAITASDPDGVDSLTYTATGLPGGLSIDSGSGLISGTVADEAIQAAPYVVTVTADDGNGQTISQTFNWMISNPSLQAQGVNLSIPEGQALDQAVLATFTTTDPNQNSNDFTATINWGDGTSGDIGFVSDGTGNFTVSGDHAYAAVGSYPVQVTITDLAGNSVTVASTVTVTPVTPQVTGGLQLGAVRGQAANLVAATFTTANLDATTGDFTATIDWGDGRGPVAANVGSAGGDIFSVSGTADYSTDGTYNAVVTVTSASGAKATTTSTIVVGDTMAGELSNLTVASFTDSDGNSQASAYTATIHWGDGTQSSGTVTGSNGVFSVQGGHTYALDSLDQPGGVYQVSVSITDSDGDTLTGNGTVEVVRPPLVLVVANAPMPTGQPFQNAAVAAFTEPDMQDTASEFTVAIDWGDGTPLDTTAVVTGSGGVFEVQGSHDYTAPGPYQIMVQVSQGWGAQKAAAQGGGQAGKGLPAGLSISSTSGQISGTLASTDDTNSPYQVTVSATDGTSTGNQTFNWTVNPRVSIALINNQSNAVGDTVSVQVSAGDANSSTLTYSATGLPSGLTISSTTGLISGTIALGADTSSPYAVTVTATDSAGVSSTQSFNWTVAHVALVNPGSQWSVDSHAVSLQMQGSDADHDTLSWTASGLPSGLSISSTGLISGTLASNADASSPYVVTVTASDGTHSTSQTFLWTVSQVALTAPANQTNTEGDTVSLQLQGLASSGSLTYSASGLPAGLSLNATTGLISGTIAPGAAAAGPFTVDVSASNGTDSVSQTFTWTVNPVVALTAVANQSNAEGNSVSLQVSATDSKNASLTYTAVGLPSGLSIGSTTGLITGTVASGDAANSPYAVTVTASDGTYSSSETFTWTVTHTDSTALTMTNPGGQTDVAGDSVNVAINASDPDGIDSLTYTATGLPDGVNIDPFSGLISGTVADDAVSKTPYQVTVTAADGNGQTVSQTFVTVQSAVNSLGAGSPWRWAHKASYKYVSTGRPCKRRVCTTVRIRSTKRQPPALLLPKEPFRHNTAPRNTRSA